MTTADAARVVWLAPAEARDDARKALDEWARARGVRLAMPSGGHGKVIAVDMRIADDVEEAIARAKDAIASLETDAAEHALARAETLLRAHPELPNAAWLMAEVTRGWAVRWLRLDPVDSDRAALAWRRASSFDGGRMAGIGEVMGDGDARAHAHVHGVLVVDDARVEVRIDGARVKAGPIEMAAGEHALVLARDGDVVGADWIAFEEGTTLRFAAPAAPSCSREDFAHVAFAASDDAVHADAVRCAEWIAVLPEERAGSIRVAACNGASCGPLVEWRGSASWRAADGGEPGRDDGAGDTASHGWPAWTKWSLAGVGVAAVATTVVIAAGAFKSAPTETRVVNGGLKIAAAAIRF